MANQIPEEALAAIEEVVRRHPNGVSAPEILRALSAPIPSRTLRAHLYGARDRSGPRCEDR